MKRRIVSGIMLTLLLIGMLTFAFNIQPVKAEPNTVYVDDDNTSGIEDGSLEYSYNTIQEAINAANPGDAVFVKNGTYYEHVSVYKSLTVVGENQSTTVIDGSGIDTVVWITANNVKISGFTMQHSGSSWSDSGVKIWSSNNSIVAGNTIRNNYLGIYLRSSSCNFLGENRIIDNTYGIHMGWYSNGNTISSNTVLYNYIGITVADSHNNDISTNRIVSNDEKGVWVARSEGNNINGNKIAYNGYCGIDLFLSRGNFLNGNEIRNNTEHGIIFWSSDENFVSENRVEGNKDGLHLVDSNRNVVEKNTVASNEWCGVYFMVIHTRCNDNAVYHNNFVDNRPNAGAYPQSINLWDDGYPYGGNYWSDYVDKGGYDVDGDGIGDVPYVIDAGNQDNYPLMEPWSVPTMIKTLIRTIGFSDLLKGTEKSFTSKLEGALHLLYIGNENGAIHKLMDFINQVEALGGKKLDTEQADYLISGAQRIINPTEG